MRPHYDDRSLLWKLRIVALFTLCAATFYIWIPTYLWRKNKEASQ
jgi:hypothetical protein